MTYRLSASSDIIVIGSTLPYFLVLKSDIFFSFWYRYFGITGTVCGGTDGTTFRRYRETLADATVYWLESEINANVFT